MLALTCALADHLYMEDRPLGLLFTELGMHVLTRLVVLPLRQWLYGVDGWTDFYQNGAFGHPWWHYRQDERGRLVLIDHAAPEPIQNRPVIPSAPATATPRPESSAPRPTGCGTSIVLPCGRSTTPIPGYTPEVHAPQIAAFDLLLYLVAHHRLVAVPRTTAGPPIHRAERSLSLLARDWGHQSGHGERRADRAIALLGQRQILERVSVGARVEYRLPPDVLARFERVFRFTVEPLRRPEDQT